MRRQHLGLATGRTSPTYYGHMLVIVKGKVCRAWRGASRGSSLWAIRCESFLVQAVFLVDTSPRSGNITFLITRVEDVPPPTQSPLEEDNAVRFPEKGRRVCIHDQ
jgi:hypothetical protein